MKRWKIEENNVDKMPPCKMLYTLCTPTSFASPLTFLFFSHFFSYLFLFPLALPFPFRLTVTIQVSFVELVGIYSMGIKWTALDPSVFSRPKYFF